MVFAKHPMTSNEYDHGVIDGDTVSAGDSAILLSRKRK